MRLPSLLAAAGVALILMPGAPSRPGASDRGGQAFAATAAHEARVLDPVARLQRRLAAGDVTLTYDSVRGYLPSLLEALAIPVSSQALVFSRTSLQTDRIAPWTPRALYFNDEVYVGWVQESPILEIAAIDPVEGAVFYTLAQTDPVTPTFQRETTTCLMCHESRAVTGGVPGLIVRSVLVDRLGYPITEIHGGTTTDRTPVERRWGGWYVTGSAGDMTHAGNVYAPDLSTDVSQKRRYLDEADVTSGSSVTDLQGRFYLEPYLTPHSDLVAIMVLTHQAQVHNLITQLHEEVLEALQVEAAALRSTGGALPAGGHLPATLARIEGPIERLVQAMLFAKEAPLAGPVRGTSAFAGEFASRGPFDGQGRSLRDLDLDTRMFRHRLSFLVHSEAFDALPPLARRSVARRFVQVLSGADARPEFAHLGEAERRAITAILEATEPELLALGREGEGEAMADGPSR